MENLLEALDGADMVRVCAMHGLFLAIKNNTLCVYNQSGEMVDYHTHVEDSLTNDQKHEWLSAAIEEMLRDG